MSTGIHVGHDQKSMQEISRAIMAILNSREDQETKRAALALLSTAAKIENVSITGCSVNIPKGKGK